MREHAPVRVSAVELEDACFFVSMMEDVTETELFDEAVYAVIPDRSELDLGTNVVRDFTASKIPDLAERVDAIFRRRGAYGQFKDMLRQEGRLELWYGYEAERLESALREWCEGEGFEMVKAASEGRE